MSDFNFIIKTSYNRARTGEITTAHGKIRTPAFMPIGTVASVKAMAPESVAATGADVILGNTYHLMLRPTSERIHKLGGLHQFMNWHKPILTDSGGFQVMSLSKLRKITEQGAEFQSYLDGSKYMLTPERSMEIQYLLGSDIVMVLDECTSYPITEEDAKSSLELSLRWAERSKKAYEKRPGHGIFGIVQGSVYPNLRMYSIKALKEIEFDGYAIGGMLAVSEGPELMFEVLDYIVPEMPVSKPRYVMGVGKPKDIIGCVKRGIDMFDCVIPTRSGRNGQAYVRGGTINVKNAKYAEDTSPLDSKCICPACTNYTKAYLHHLVRSKEILGSMLMTWHNLQYYQDLMQALRESIENGTIDEFEVF